jgi:hypothetical protein
MADERDRQPTTFWRDWWRFARERIAQRLPSPFRSFLTNGLTLTLTLFLGGLLFGAPFILDQAERYVAQLLTFALMLIAWPVIFLVYLLSAPAAMWKRDQEIIAQLRASLTPTLKLTFDEQCLRSVPRGRVTPSLSGHRFHDSTGSDRHLLIKCINCSKVTVEGVQARMVALKPPPPDHDASPFTQFFHPVLLREFGTDADTTALPPEAETSFCVLIQPTEFDPPRPNEREPHYHYEFLFTRPGTYEIGIEAHGQNTAVARTVLMMDLKKEWVSDGMGHKHPTYEIVPVRPDGIARLETIRLNGV